MRNRAAALALGCVVAGAASVQRDSGDQLALTSDLTLAADDVLAEIEAQWCLPDDGADDDTGELCLCS